MKKAVSLILTLVICLSLCACGNNKTKQSYDVSKKAFEYVTSAYLETNEFSEDIYEAWYLGVHDKYGCDSEYELSVFCNEMNIERKYIEQAIANLYGATTYSSSDKMWEYLPKLYNNSYFSAWVSVISEAYKCSGKSGQISDKLNSAKDLMKSLSSNYSDYEHYPALKVYFTNTIAFCDFCNNPEGSFDQVAESFNNYRNTAREYFFALNYVFSDSVGGMDEFLAPDSTATTPLS